MSVVRAQNIQTLPWQTTTLARVAKSLSPQAIEIAVFDDAGHVLWASTCNLSVARVATELKTVDVVLTPAAGVQSFNLLFSHRRTTVARVALYTHAENAAEALTGSAWLVQSTLQGELDRERSKIENNTLSTQLSDTYEELTLIHQLSAGMMIDRGTGDFFKMACEQIQEIIGCRGVGYAIIAGHSCELFGEVGLTLSDRQALGQMLCELSGQSSKPLLINNVSSHLPLSPFAASFTRLLCVPLRREKQLGCFFAIDKSSEDFNTQDAKLLGSIANETSIYLENAGLFSNVRELVMGLLHSMTSAVDAKDSYTSGHSRRVALLSKELAVFSGSSQHDAERIYMAGLLHDVGKIGISESVLRKPGKLTDEEFTEMKKHPEIGARILGDIAQIQDLIPGVLHHHERYDGRGYPHRLLGHDIPLMARIMCIADSYDAMTSNRTYRRGLPHNVALLEIRRCGGTHFDPTLTEAFLAMGRERIANILRQGDEPARAIAA